MDNAGGIATPSKFAGRRTGMQTPPHGEFEGKQDDKRPADPAIPTVPSEDVYGGTGIRKTYSRDRMASTSETKSRETPKTPFRVPPLDTGKRNKPHDGPSSNKGLLSTRSADASAPKDILVQQAAPYAHFQSPRIGSTPGSARSKRSRRSSDSTSTGPRRSIPKRNKHIPTPVTVTSTASTAQTGSSGVRRKKIVKRHHQTIQPVDLQDVAPEHADANVTQGIPLPPELGDVAHAYADPREEAIVRIAKSPARTMRPRPKTQESPAMVPRHPFHSPGMSPLNHESKETPVDAEGLGWLEKHLSESSFESPHSSASTPGPRSMIDMDDATLPKMKKKRGPFVSGCACTAPVAPCSDMLCVPRYSLFAEMFLPVWWVIQRCHWNPHFSVSSRVFSGVGFLLGV